MRIWLDDYRPMPAEGYDKWCKTGGEIINELRTGKVTHIAFDHDLGFTSITGYDVASYIESHATRGLLKPPTWTCHSINPIGAMRINQAMERAHQAWNKREESIKRWDDEAETA